MYLVRPPYLVTKFYSKITWRMSSSEKIIYLTFDDGPIPVVTPWVLDTLKQYDAKATFFCVGDNVQKHPDIFKQVLSSGHSVGNHTFNHLNGWKTSAEDYIRNVNLCSEKVKANLFRPPYGRFTRKQYTRLTGCFAFVMWDVLSGDFDTNTSPKQCLQNVLKYTREGSIIVFHDSLKAERNLRYALPQTLEHFSRLGYRFSRLETIKQRALPALQEHLFP